MTYVLFNWLDEEAWAALGEAEQDRIKIGTKPLVEELTAAGKFLGGAPLHPAATGTVVQVCDGKRIVTDGPFIETREQIAGYALIEAADLDEAIEISAKILAAAPRPSRIEIRPVPLVDDVASCTGAEATEAGASDSLRRKTSEQNWRRDRELSA